MKTKQRILSLLMALCMVLTLLPVTAQAETVDSGTCGEDLTWSLDGAGTLTISGTGPMTKFHYYERDDSRSTDAPWYSLRESVKQVVMQPGVTEISSYAFYGLYHMRSVTIPDSVTTIGDYAFSNCSSLTAVTIPDSVTTIPNYAFYYCRALTSVTIPDSVTLIGICAFYGCTSLTSVTIPDSVTTIGGSAFGSCSALTSVTIPDSVTTIGRGAFYRCSKLRSVTIPDSVRTIGGSAFSNCTALTAVTIPDSVTAIGSYAFEYCTSLTAVTIPDSVMTIGNYAFSNCTSLTSVTIPDSVTTIGESAFEYCTSLTSVTIPDSVASIYESAFSSCYGLTEVTIGSGVTYIGGAAFGSCDHLRTVTFRGAAPVFGGGGERGDDLPFHGVTATVYYPANGFWTAGRRQNYEGDLTWVPYSDVAWIVDQPETVVAEADTTAEFHVLAYGPGITYQWQVKTTGGDWTDSALTGADTDTLRVTATESRDGYRYRCVVTDENGVQAVSDAATLLVVVTGGTCGEDLTWKLDGAGTLTISGTGPMTKFHYYESDGSTDAPWYSLRESVKQVVMKPGVTEISSYAFRGLSALTAVTIPDSVTTIGDYAFYYCRALTAVTIPDSVTSISSYAFASCTALTSVTIPDSVTSIGICAFYGCTSLTSVTIPDSVTSIGICAFFGCTSLTAVTIPDSVRTIDSSAFSGCSALTALTIPDSVTLIGDSAFFHCSALTAVTIPDSVTSIGRSAFSSCYGLTEVTIGSGVIDIWDEAFGSCDHLRTVTFRGAAPEYSGDGEPPFSDSSFHGVTATVYYPGQDASWTAGRRQNYGGDLTWVPYSDVAWIVDQPQMVVAEADTTAEFHVLACGPGITYQWQVKTTGGDWTDSALTGADTDTLRVKATESRDGYRYRCVVTDENGVQAVSDAAILLVGVAGGTCGEDLTWKLDGAGTLTISGTGPMTKFHHYESDGSTDAPWYSLRESVKQVVMKPGVTEISNCAFYGLSALTAVTIPDSVTAIGDYAFSWCTALTTVTIPDSVTSIGDDAFYYCTALITVTIPDSVMTIGNYAFYQCRALTSVTIPDGVTTIGYYSFSGCSALTAVTIPDSVMTIGISAFYQCYRLTAVTIPDSVTTIDERAFSSCYALTEVTIGSGVTSIGGIAFASCDHLRAVTFRGAAPSVEDTAFSNVTATVYYPANDTSWTAGRRQNYGGDLTWEPYSDVAWIVDQPQTVVAEADTTVEFHVLGCGPGITYQWQVKTTGGDWTDSALTGARTDTLRVKATKSRNGYRYRCVVTDENGVQAVSNAATLLVGVAGGTCGEDLTWKLDGAGTLTISGQGAIRNYSFEWESYYNTEEGYFEVQDLPPWYGRRESIRAAVIGQGVNAIGEYAFRDCYALTEVTFRGAVPDIASGAFSNVTATVNYPANDASWTAERRQNYGGDLTWEPYSDVAWIVDQPADVSAAVDENAVFTVRAAGPNLTYQWQVKTTGADWTNTAMTGAKTATLTVPVKASRNGYQYRCIVTDGNGVKVTSRAATLAVLAVITDQPQDYRGVVNDTATFTVKAVGPGLKYQWQVKTTDADWTNTAMTGAKTTALTVPVKASRNGYEYRCIITDANGRKLYSEAARLWVDMTITGQPEGVSVAAGETARFTVKATGAGLQYQWEYHAPFWSDWEWYDVYNTTDGASAATVGIPVDQNMNNYEYRCRITDANGNTNYSEIAVLKIKTVITAQPQNVMAYVYNWASFSVEAKGPSLQYQWQYKAPESSTWNNCDNANWFNYELRVTPEYNKYQYRCVITDVNGAVTYSDAATLTVRALLRNQNYQVNLPVDEVAQFFVYAEGVDLTYQWQVKTTGADWTNTAMTGAKTPNLQVPVKASRNGYQYRCVITDANGLKLYSEPATLLVQMELVNHPQSIYAPVGDTVTFYAEATGAGLQYQWQYRTPGGSWADSSLSGYRSDTLHVKVTASRNKYQYRCIVSDANGTKRHTAAATLGVLTIINRQPQSVTAAIGQTATFTVVATGAGLKYQWQFRAPDGEWSNTTLTGAKTATLSVPVNASRNGYEYQCIITDANGGEYYSAFVTLTVATNITGQPKDVLQAVGTTAQFSVKATGVGLKYQWQYKTSSGRWVNSTMTGAKTATMQLKATAARSGREYRCVITDANGHKTYSTPATLTVR